MADTFPAIAAASVTAMVDTLGQTATYTPDGGSPSTITCVLNRRIEEELSTFDRPVYEEQHEIVFDLADVPSLGKNDTVLIGSTTYTVTEITDNDGYSITANVKD